MTSSLPVHPPLLLSQGALLFCSSLILLYGCGDFGHEGSRGPYSVPETSDIQPACSPDGRYVAYRHEDNVGADTTYPTGLYLIETNGTGRRLLVEGRAALPAWSPNGEWIAFTAGAIYAIHVSDDSLFRITNFAGFFPSWSPDGLYLCCDRSGTQDTVGIWIVSISGSSAERFDYGSQAHWSPDGEKFVYEGVPDPYSGPQIFTIRISDRTERRMLTNNGRNNSNMAPKWSPQGDRITWFITASANDQSVWVMESDGSLQREVIDGFDPCWSNDEQRIVFSRTMGKQVVLWSVRHDGSDAQQLTH